MTFQHIPDPNTGLSEWYAYDSLGGFHINIKPCSDNSGYIARIVDSFTGEKIAHKIASNAQTLANWANDAVNKMTAKGFITSL